MAAFVLLVTLLLMGTSNVSGSVWCVGNDCHIKVSYAIDSVCCSSDLRKNGGSWIGRYDDNNCDLCKDFPAQQGEAVFSKRVKRVSPTPHVSLSAGSFSAGTVSSGKHSVAKNLAPSVPRIAQTLLSLRTVVLLN